MKPRLPASSFYTALIRHNRLDTCGICRFVFFRGMLFGSVQKWWGKKGCRTFSHEGLDLCFFENAGNEKFRLDNSTVVPMIYDARVESITDDFLGKTVIASHCFDDTGHPLLLSLYGHLEPDKNLTVGDTISEGASFAKIADIDKKRTSLLPHVHISFARPEMLPPPDQLTWEFLNTADRSAFMDPLEAIKPEYIIREYNPALNLSEMYLPCSRLIPA